MAEMAVNLGVVTVLLTTLVIVRRVWH